MPALRLIFAFTKQYHWTKTHALEAGLLVGAASVLLTWPVAVLSERWVERPSIEAGRWIWSRSRTWFRARTAELLTAVDPQAGPSGS